MAFDWLTNNSSALLAASAGLLGGKTANEQASMGLQGFAGAREAAQQKNKTLAFLKQMNPELAQAVEAGALSPLDAYKTHLEAQKPKKPNFLSAGGSLYNPDTGEWLSPPEGQGQDAEYGLAPVWGKDAQGNTVLGQLAKNGTFQQTQLPDGFTPTPGISNSDLGTSIVTRNNRTGEVIAQTPKDLAGAEREKAVGGALGANQAALPATIAKAENMLKTIDAVKNDPYRQQGTGASSIFNMIPATGGYDFAGKVGQLKGQAFLEAFNSLKGGGAITEIEGLKAEQAIARLDVAQSEEAFAQALNDLEDVVNAGIARAKLMAGQGGAQQPAGNTGQTKGGVSWSIEP
jgi:hypothetical protein